MKNKHLVVVIALAITLSLCFVSTPVAAVDPPGVGSTPSLVTTPSNWGYKTDYIITPYLTLYTGVVTTTSLNYEIKLSGPLVPHSSIPRLSYVKSASLTLQRIESYEPVFIVKSLSWYTHKLELTSSSSQQFKFEVKTGISVADGGCSIEGGYSVTTATSMSSGWSVTAQSGQTKVVYLRMIFLRVFGSVTYNINPWTTQTIEYDSTILELVDFNNNVVRTLSTTYPETPVSSSKYYDNPYDGDSSPDKFYYLGTKYFLYSESMTQTTFFGVSFETPDDVPIVLSGTAKFETEQSTSTTLKHTFTGTFPRNVAYYYLKLDNFFNVNLKPVYQSSGGGGGGKPWVPVID